MGEVLDKIFQEMGLKTTNCVQCGQRTTQTAKFCPECGAQLHQQQSLISITDGMSKETVVSASNRHVLRDIAWPDSVVIVFAVLAAIAVKIPALFGYAFDGAEGTLVYARNASFFVLPLLTGYFAWKRRFRWKRCLWLGLPFALGAPAVNIFPFIANGSTELLTILHLPIALWLVVGIAYTGERWTDGERRMSFVRFSGELFIYYTLIALGGGVLVAFTVFMFGTIGLDVEWFVLGWLLPCGATGAVIVAAGFVEAQEGTPTNMAPVLTRLFTPLFAAVLLVFLGTVVWTSGSIDVEREVLIGFDLLLVLVLGLLLYAVSARDPKAPPNAFDVLQLSLIFAALVVDLIALAAITARISEFGFSPNKVAALGENLVLLLNLLWSTWIYTCFFLKRGSFVALARWQTSYLPVYSMWAGLVVVTFPPLFGYI